MIKTGREIVPVEKQTALVAQQVQIANKFAILEVDNSEANENNQLLLVEENLGQRVSSNAKESRTLNHAAPAFNPKSPRTIRQRKATVGNLLQLERTLI